MDWDQEEDELYVALLYTCGFSTREVEAVTHHDRKTTIPRILKRFNIPLRFHKNKYYMWQKIFGNTQLCECGCGNPVPLASKTNTRAGIVKGQPLRFIHNHHVNGKRLTEETKEKLRQKKWETDNPHWKGDDVSPNVGRARARRRFLTLGKCEMCDQSAMDRHHKDGDTKNNAPDNVQLLCRLHHMIVDGRIEKLRSYGYRRKNVSVENGV